MAKSTDTPSDTPLDTSSDTPFDTTDRVAQLCEQAARYSAQATPGQVELYRITNGTRAMIDRYDFGAFDPFDVSEKWGGGKYFARLKVNGRYGLGATFDVEGTPITRPIPFAGVAPQPALATAQSGDGLSSRDFLQLMMNQQSQQQQMFMQMMQANAQQTQLMIQTLVSKTRETPMTEMLTTFEKMKGMADAGGTAAPSMIGEIAELAKGLGLAPVIGAMAADAMKPTPPTPEVKPQRRRVHNAQRGPAGNAPAGNGPQPTSTPAPSPTSPAQAAEANATATTVEEKTKKLMGQQLRTIRQLASAAIQPRLAAHSLFGLVDDIEEDEVRDAVLNSIAGTTPEDFANALPLIAPEFSRPAHREWIIKTHTELRAMVQELQADAAAELQGEAIDDPDDPNAPDPDAQTGEPEDTAEKSDAA